MESILEELASSNNNARARFSLTSTSKTLSNSAALRPPLTTRAVSAPPLSSPSSSVDTTEVVADNVHDYASLVPAITSTTSTSINANDALSSAVILPQYPIATNRFKCSSLNLNSVPTPLANALIVYLSRQFDWSIRRAKKARNLQALQDCVDDKKQFLQQHDVQLATISLPPDFASIDNSSAQSQLTWLLHEVALRAEELWDSDASADDSDDVAMIRDVEEIRSKLLQDQQLFVN